MADHAVASEIIEFYDSPYTANPVNVMDYTATLVKNSAGRWVVGSPRGDFVPNEGP